MLETRRAVRHLVGLVDDLDARVVREIKTRAGQASVDARRRDPLVEKLVERAQEPPGEAIAGGGATRLSPFQSGSAVLAEARRRGVVR
jgi:hypothetical protein